MNLGGFIDKFKDAIAKRVVESYPPLYRPSENGGTLPRLLRKPLGAQADAIRGAALFSEGTPGHHGRRRDGHGQDLHRRRSRAHGGLRAHPHHLPAPPGAQVEAGGGDDGARRPRRHRRVHHRPGAASPLRRLRPPVRRDEPGEGQAVLPLDARRHTAVGHVQGKAAAGGGDGGALPGPLLPRLHRAGRRQGRRAAHGRRPEPPQAHLRRLRRSPLAGRQVRPRPLPAGRLHQAPDEGLLRPADRRRSSRVQGARERPGHRRRHPRRRVRQVPQPHRDAPRRLLLDHLPPALPVLPGDSHGVRTVG